ncbi:MAG: excinuclease ABC subunit C [Candidatus Pelagibacter sp. TMED273]|nr:MAG: excinuclease ABC subunit C [Candidatus Pelagibacter sp. TMED273]
MMFYVYLLATKNKNKIITYTGYSNNLKKRIKLHNEGKGAKFTRGRKWKLIYYKEYSNRSKAMIEEFKLKKNRKLKNMLKKSYCK